jgi:hypothetical protein
MAYTGRAPSAAPLTSGDITDGAVAPVDLSTGAPSWDTSGNLTVDGGAVFNEAGADVDFRVESDTNANALFLEGSSGNVGIGTSSPSKVVHVKASSDSSGTPIIGLSPTTTDNIQGGIGCLAGGVLEVIGANLATFFTASTERMRIDSSGNLLAGKTAIGYTTDGFEYRDTNNKLYLSATSGNPLNINRNTSDGSFVDFTKDGTTVGSIGSRIGQGLVINSQGADGKLQKGGADNFVWNPQYWAPASDNSADCGLPSLRFDDIYATNGTIQTSDRNEKQDIEELSEAEQRVAVACKGLLRKFRWKDAVVEKGDDARIHFGIIAQDLQDAFAAEGLDAGRYAMFISSTWWETQTEVPAVEAVEAQEAVYDDEGNLVSEAVEAVEAKEAYTRTDTYDTAEEAPEGATERTRLGVRYPELLAFIIAAI